MWGTVEEGTLLFRKDSAVLLLAELFKSTARMFSSNYKAMGGYSVEVMKVLDRLEAYQPSSRREVVG